MPEHVHVLLCPRRANYDMSQILAALKRPVSVLARQYLVERGETTWLERLTVTWKRRSVFRFWQPGGGYDHNVVRERSVEAIMEYIHANPVRRELVARPTDWEWSSARFWMDGRRDVPLAMDHPRDLRIV